MTLRSSIRRTLLRSTVAVALCAALFPAFAQQSVPHDPAEPQQARPHPKLLPRPAASIARQSIDAKSMRALIDQLVSCGTRLSLSSWTLSAVSAAAAITSQPASTKSRKIPVARCRS
jgi:hypothetical protein